MIKFSKKHRYLLSILSGILLTISFPFTGGLAILAYVAWIPLLLVEANISKESYRSRKVFTHALITFLIYNIGTTWWIVHASIEGALMAFIANTLIMSLVFYLFHYTKKWVGSKEGYFSLLFYWIAFEYFHHNWESSWPWLTIGNTFSNLPSWIQWYSYSGTLGGTLWVLCINLLLFRACQNVFIKGESWKIQTPFFYLSGLFFILPLTISLTMYYSYEEEKRPVEIVVIQPNIDPYKGKFSIGLYKQLDKVFDLANQEVTKNTALIVAPETAISSSFYEEDFWRLSLFQYLINAKSKLLDIPICIGASTMKNFENKNSSASMKNVGGPGFYESYNTSVLINKDNEVGFIHKSKLVPGVEIIPFTSYFSFLEDLSIDLGGSRGTLGTEEEPMVFATEQFKFAPVICYESIYGEFVAKQCRKGAEIICILTNDGWWRNTPGYKQHNSFASIRAIENRRSVVRSANTGISCFINQRGDISQETKWWTADVIKGNLNLNKNLTFYTIYGNVIGRSFSFVSVFLLLFTLVKHFKKYTSK